MAESTQDLPSMAEVTHHPQGTFSWVELSTTDVAAAKAFYGRLFGWTFEDMPMGNDQFYTMAHINGKQVAGLQPLWPQMQEMGVPPNWATYLAVDDVDALAPQVEAAGGKLLMPPFDVLDSGRMVTIQDPSGGTLGLWQARNHIGSAYTSGPGVASWFELLSHDVPAAAQFFRTLLGWRIDEFVHDGYAAAACHRDGAPVSMILEIRPEWGQMPSTWMPYFAADVEPAVAAIQEMGGSVVMGPLVSSGYPFALVHDAQGALFYLIGAPKE